MKTVRRDQGSEFYREFEEYLRLNGVRIMTTGVARPQGNGQLERRHADMHFALRSELHDRNMDTKDWDLLLPTVITKLNRRPLDCLNNLSPFEMMHQTKPFVPTLEFINRNFNNEKIEEEEDEVPKPAFFRRGDKVLYRHAQEQHRPNKLSPQWIGPYIVVENMGGNGYVYKIQSVNATTVNDAVIIAHVNCLKPVPPSLNSTHNNQDTKNNK